MSANIIEVQGLQYTYPDAEESVLKGVNLQVKEGEILGVMGPTGAGKTTLCMCFAGLIPHSIGGELKGNVIIDGMETTERELIEIVERVAFVFQDPEVQFFGMDVREDVTLQLRNLGMPEEEIDKRLKWALHCVRLDGFEKRFPYTLSGGEKQRVAIAGALATRPKIFILDEPSSELDPVGKREVFETIREMKRFQKSTIIIVEHNSEEIARIADRIIVINKGEIAVEGTPSEVFPNIPEDLGVRSPDVTRLGSHLQKSSIWREYGYPMVIEDAYNRLSDIIKKKRLSPIQHPPIALEKTKRGETFVEIRNLSHVYGKGTPEEVVALRDITVDIHQGELVALIGQNGSGKTTLVKHFNGLLKPTKGHVIVRGVDTRKASVTELSRMVGYCFQNPDHQIFKQNVYDEVAFGPRNILGSGHEDEVRERVEEALETVGLTGYEKQNPFFLGKGERQKVAVASVLAMRPQLLIVDEPTTGMDWKTSKAMMKLIKGLHLAGHTIIFITHNMPLVAEYAERVIVLHQGKILLDGPTRWVFSHVEKLEGAFIKPPQITQLGYLMKNYLRPGVLTVEEAFEDLQRLSQLNERCS